MCVAPVSRENSQAIMTQVPDVFCRHLQHNREPYAAAERRVRHALVVSTGFRTFCAARHWHLVLAPRDTNP
ncbi:hypothetical protein KGM_216180 [Danaus plexippus plexippus]|uniref:Uncharacterized protein n=1 Tax=Danaus plexippus plexippus TaxID=278856 RepID=A0A212ELM5_DANPL|nr:hypothetical protein KGM_216180 [Danaus plexippus plexippus]